MGLRLVFHSPRARPVPRTDRRPSSKGSAWGGALELREKQPPLELAGWYARVCARDREVVAALLLAQCVDHRRRHCDTAGVACGCALRGSRKHARESWPRDGVALLEADAAGLDIIEHPPVHNVLIALLVEGIRKAKLGGACASRELLRSNVSAPAALEGACACNDHVGREGGSLGLDLGFKRLVGFFSLTVACPHFVVCGSLGGHYERTHAFAVEVSRHGYHPLGGRGRGQDHIDQPVAQTGLAINGDYQRIAGGKQLIEGRLRISRDLLDKSQTLNGLAFERHAVEELVVPARRGRRHDVRVVALECGTLSG
mmetsp:Transcript_40527/g.93147  ORF Transcript_40527/g.93147 Transcript_40527/m.93147 type:complete len:314 (+) Transcript_40527:142-1083(+)